MNSAIKDVLTDENREGRLRSALRHVNMPIDIWNFKSFSLMKSVGLHQQTGKSTSVG
jgi:hypothetical protein